MVLSHQASLSVQVPNKKVPLQGTYRGMLRYTWGLGFNVHLPNNSVLAFSVIIIIVQVLAGIFLLGT